MFRWKHRVRPGLERLCFSRGVSLWRGRSGSGARLQGDQPGTALERQIGPRPAQRDDEAVADADQEVDVRDAPHQPAEKAGQLLLRISTALLLVAATVRLLMVPAGAISKLFTRCSKSGAF